MLAKLAAEFLGTFWLVLGGCGCAVLAGAPGAQHGAGAIRGRMGAGATLGVLGRAIAGALAAGLLYRRVLEGDREPEIVGRR